MQNLNVNLSDAQLKKLKTAVKKKTRKTLKLSLKMLHGNDLPHELLLTARQKTKLRNELNNTMSTDLALSKAQISKLIQSGGFLWSLLSKLVGPLMKVAIPLAKNVLAPLEITAAASAIDERIQKKIHGCGRPSSTTVIISNKEMNDMKILKFKWKESRGQLKTKQNNKKDDS